MLDSIFEEIRKPGARKLVDSVYFDLDSERVNELIKNPLFIARTEEGERVMMSDNIFDLNGYNQLTEKLTGSLEEGGLGFTLQEIHAASLVSRGLIILE